MGPHRDAPASPQQQIEHLVQERAKHLDLDGPDALATLSSIVGEEIARWNDDHRRGGRRVELAPVARVHERALRNLAGYGPLSELLDDDDVWEIAVNAPDQIFVRRHRGANGYHPDVFHDDEHVLRTVTKLLDDSTSSHRKLDPAEGLQDAQLDDGSRVHLVHPDVSRGGHLMVNIRRFTGVPFTSLRELTRRGMLTPPAATLLASAVRAGCSIVIAGVPGSGKTTLLSCCAAELDPAARVAIAEEVFEIDVGLPNVAQMQTRPPRPDRPPVDLRRLVAGFLRMAPDVAIVGEVRDREALPLLLTLSSGVAGLTTIHAGSAQRALTRLRLLCQLSGDVHGALPLAALNGLVADSVDVVVHCDRTGGGPRVEEIVAVEELAGGADAAQFTVTSLFRREEHDGSLAWTGNVSSRLASRLQRAGADLRAVLQSRTPARAPAHLPVTSPATADGRPR